MAFSETGIHLFAAAVGWRLQAHSQALACHYLSSGVVLELAQGATGLPAARSLRAAPRWAWGRPGDWAGLCSRASWEEQGWGPGGRAQVVPAPAAPFRAARMLALLLLGLHRLGD